jgi:hypothetical protein
MTTTLAFPEVELDKIDVVDGFIIRSKMDDAELQEIAATIRDVGVMQPVSVLPKEDDRFNLVYGHQRFEAAKIALAQAEEEGADTSKLTKIRVTPSGDDPILEPESCLRRLLSLLGYCRARNSWRTLISVPKLCARSSRLGA